jgi:hypothetical protein
MFTHSYTQTHAYKNTHIYIYSNTYVHTFREIDRQIDRQTNRQTLTYSRRMPARMKRSWVTILTEPFRLISDGVRLANVVV